MDIITLSNIKGGVGKTTIAYNLGAYLAEKGKKVLMMDLDPQCNLSATYRNFEIDSKEATEGTVAEIFKVYEDEQKPVRIRQVAENVDLIPGSSALDKIQSRLETYNNKNLILFSWLRNNFDQVVTHYDYMIIDCHPDMNVATKNAICVSDVVLAPITPNRYSFRGMQNLEARIEELKKETINFVTGDTMVKAKLYYIANDVPHNTGIGRDFMATVEEENKNGGKWIAKIPHFELFNRASYSSIPISEMEKIAKVSVDEIPEQLRNDPLFMNERRYFSNQKQSTYDTINEAFDKIVKYI